jgi:hypothetical protein
MTGILIGLAILAFLTLNLAAIKAAIALEDWIVTLREKTNASIEPFTLTCKNCGKRSHATWEIMTCHTCYTFLCDRCRETHNCKNK